MRHAIAEAIVENGKIQYIDSALPKGRIRVHLVYDTAEDSDDKLKSVLNAVRKTAGVYKKIDPAKEAKSLRNEWSRVGAR